MKVPFVDLRPQHEEVYEELEAVFRHALHDSAFVGGQPVAAFEKAFAAYCGAAHAVTCANGTDALKLALMAAGVSAGDAVITVPNTFIATVEALTLVGAHPVFVDVEPTTYNLSPTLLEAFLIEQCRPDADGRVVHVQTGRPVTAVLPVHLYGLPADMGPILALAHQYNLRVIEDACQAHGAFYQLNGVQKRAGALSDVAAFSFYPGKNLGAIGEGGAIVTDDGDMAQRMRMWRDHGQSEKYVHISSDGWNSRLDTIQCAVLAIKLRRLDEWNGQRRRIAAWYCERLAGEERIVLPVEPVGRQHVYHLFVIRVPDREKTRQRLLEQGIAVGMHYPIPIHLQPAYCYHGWQTGDYPETETAAASILSLPMYPHLSEQQVDYVCHVLRTAV